MAINFPLVLPATPAFKRFELIWPAMVSRSGGGLAASEQVYEWDDGPLRAMCTLPPFGEGPAPLDRATLGQWEAFLLGLRGPAGTFLMGDPRHAALMGIGPAAGWLPRFRFDEVAGAKSIRAQSWGASRSGILKRGDVFQVCKNYLLSPRAFDSANWTKTGVGAAAPVVTADVVDNPEPGAVVTDADQIDFALTGAGQNSQIYQDCFARLPASAGWAFTGTVWMRAGSSLSITLQIEDGVSLTETVCNLTTSWAQFSLSRTLASGATLCRFKIYNPENQAAKTIYAYGANLYSAQLDARLHKVIDTADPDSDANGAADISIMPRLRAAIPDFSPLILTSAVGTWRLGRSMIDRSLEPGMIATIGFEAIEAINLV